MHAQIQLAVRFHTPQDNVALFFVCDNVARLDLSVKVNREDPRAQHGQGVDGKQIAGAHPVGTHQSERARVNRHGLVPRGACPRAGWSRLFELRERVGGHHDIIRTGLKGHTSIQQDNIAIIG